MTECARFARLALALAALAWAGQICADIVRVEINGLNERLTTNARKLLSLTAEHEDPWTGEHIRRLYRLAPDQIRTALQPYGYYDPRIEASLEPPEQNGKTWHATFRIEHGPPTVISRLKLAVTGPGRNQSSLQAVLENSELEVGERLIQPHYKTTKQALATTAREAGYLQARFTKSSIRIKPKANRAEIALVLATGPRYYFGQVQFQQSVLKDSFARRFVPFEPGDPFSNDQLLELQLTLAKAHYFKTITINAKRDQPQLERVVPPWFHRLIFGNAPYWPAVWELRVPVTVRAKPSSPVHFRISAGYGTDTGPRIGLGLDLRHINRYGHTFHADLRVSRIKQQLHASYNIPIQNVTRDTLAFTADIANQEFGDLTAFRYGVGVVRDVGWKYGRRRLSLHFLRSRYDLHDGAGTRVVNLLYPAYHLTFQLVDKPLNPTRGFSASIDIRGGLSAVASSTNFLRSDLQATALYPLASRIDLLVRGRFGAIQASNFAKLPPSQRFFAGGQTSIRGYGYQSISPTNGDRVDVGGKFLAVASVETIFWVYGDFGLATFFDVGDVSNTLAFDFKRGVGIGFRWASPIGMVTFDLAHPIDGSKAVSIGFSIGPRL